MRSSATILLASAASVLAAPEARLATRQSACADVHLFLAPGNNEVLPGRQAQLINDICAGNPSCDWEGIQYTNYAGFPYCDGLNEGVASGHAQINAYNARCPNSKLVISGYSQGAQVVGDIVGGAGGNFFQDCLEYTVPGIDRCSKVGKQIAAILTVGDTRHTAFQPYNQLSGAGKQGIFPRSGSALAILNSYASVYHDYCVESDPICAGGDTVANHLNYYDIYTTQLAAFVKQQLASPQVDSSCGTVSTTSTVSVSTSVPVPSNGSIILSPTYTLRPTTVPVVSVPAYQTSSIPYVVTSVGPNGATVSATKITDSSIMTSVPVIPSATAPAVVVTVDSVVPVAATATMSGSTYAIVGTGAASSTGAATPASPSSTGVAPISANGAMSLSVGSSAAVVVVAAVMAML